MLSERETYEIRILAKEIRELKEANYDSLTWEAAKEKAVSECSQSEDDYFRKMVLLGYFLSEERALTSLEIFLETLPDQIENMKQRARGYSLSRTDRQKLFGEVQSRMADLNPPTNDAEAYDYYQLLIQKVFVTRNLDQLLKAICELSDVLREFYPGAYLDAQIIASNQDKIRTLTSSEDFPLTKKEMAEKTGMGEGEVGLIMSRLAQLGIFEIGKKGRYNIYRYLQSNFETNTLRREWDWMTAFSIYLTVVSAYLVVTYFAGANLSRLQTTILSTLFVLAATITLVSFRTQSLAVIHFQVQLNEFNEVFSVINAPIAHNLSKVIITLFAGGILASLYFMFDIRRKVNRNS